MSTDTPQTVTRPHPNLPPPMQRTDAIIALDERVRGMLRRYAPTAMRWALALVYIWFGALKIVNVTPVEALVADTLAFVPLPASVVVPALGVIEVSIGVLLLVGRTRRLALVVLLGHLVGTFLVLVTQTHTAFQAGNPLLLTTDGEFVIKNLVLISGALLLAAALPPLRRRRH